MQYWIKDKKSSLPVTTQSSSLSDSVGSFEFVHPLCPYTTIYISAQRQRLLRETWSGQLPDLYDYSARHRDFTLDASASTNRNVAREDVVQKHHQTAARCRRLLAGEPRHPWFVTKWGFSAAPEAPCPALGAGSVSTVLNPTRV